MTAGVEWIGFAFIVGLVLGRILTGMDYEHRIDILRAKFKRELEKSKNGKIHG